MIRGVIFVLVVALFAGMAWAGSCNPDIALVSQDPYPAQPGEYVKVVFQVDDISEPGCGDVNFMISEGYPFFLDGGPSGAEIEGGFYARNFGDFLLAPYELRVDENALEGENSISVSLSYGESGSTTEDFNITIEDSRTDFEIHIKEYSFDEEKLTLEIINIGESDAEAVLISLPGQEGMVVTGSNLEFIGDIDSNEDDSVSFDVTMNEGDVKVDVWYSDQIGNRRKLEKVFLFDGAPFLRQVTEDEGMSARNAFIIGLVIPIVLLIIWRWYKKRKAKMRKKFGLRR